MSKIKLKSKALRDNEWEIIPDDIPMAQDGGLLDLYYSKENEKEKLFPQKEWLKNWIENPEFEKRLTSNLKEINDKKSFFNKDIPYKFPFSFGNSAWSEEAKEQKLNALKNLKKVKEFYTEGEDKNIKLGVAYSKAMFPNDKEGATYQALDLLNNNRGEYSPYTHSLFINSQLNDQSTAVHEFTHSTHLDSLLRPLLPQAKKVKDEYNRLEKENPGFKITNDIYGNPILSNFDSKGFFDKTKYISDEEFDKKFRLNKDDVNYLNQSDEIYPRIMQLRYENNIKPGQNIDKNLFKSIKKTSGDNRIFEIYNDDEVIDLMNKLAQEKENLPLNKAKNGGKIKTDPQGYWNKENHGKPVRIPSNQITMEDVDQPLYGIDDTGFAQMMYPGQDYTFPGNSVTEFPVKAQNGGSVSSDWEIMQEGGEISINEFRPKFANSNENIQRDIYRNANAKQQEAIELQPVEITARRTNPLGFAGQSLKSQQTNPANIPASQVASQIFSFIPEALHTPSRAVNYALGADNPYQSEISETLGLKHNDPTDMWAGLRNFAVDNAADFIAPELPSLGYKGLKQTVMSIDDGINAVEPYVNSLGKTKRIFQSYNQQVNPKFINPLEQELLHTVRNTGLSLKNADDLYVPETIQKVLDRSKNLSSEQFKKLTGFEKEELLERIEKLKSGELKKSEPVPINRESTINLQRPENYRRGRVLLPEQNVNINNTGWQSIESNLTNTGNTYRPREYNFNLNRNYTDDIDYNFFKKENVVDKLNNKLQARISKKLNLAESVEKPANTESLINYLGADKGEQAVKKQLITAIRRVKNAGKGETFVPSNSLSTDSYPLSYKLLSSVKDDVNLNFHGMTGLNDMGFSGKIGIPVETNLKEINSVIAEINKGQSKKIPFAKIIDGQIKAPIISATKKKLGGKINSSDWEIIQD